ncbi:MAG: outer membrane protein assembly factor BamA [Candidatus Ratteibacteria bacterium]|nr:outer membrane protein assembly factor BamA [Candidatus Ratteibacteria bacterium]
MENKTSKKLLLNISFIISFLMFMLLVFPYSHLIAEEIRAMPLILNEDGVDSELENSRLSETENNTEKIVKRIEISGNKRVSQMIILSRIQTKEEEVLSEKVISQDIKNIYALGYFSNISVQSSPFEEGVKVIYTVEEKPYIEKIELKGNRVIKEEEIQRVLSVSAGDIYLEKNLEADIERIIELYEKKGYYKTQITPEVKTIEAEKSVAIIFNIEEGPRTKVKEIKILGNKNVPEKQIRDKMETKTAQFFRRGIFGKEEFQRDLQRIVAVCQSFGYLDAKIVNYDLKYTQEGRLLFITIEIEEGELYTVREINITGNNLFETEALLNEIKIKEGKPYNPYGVPEDISALRNLYAQKGYIVTQIWDEPFIDKEKKEVKTTYRINEGPKIYVRLIRIIGNTRTKDNVIRRELTIKPADAFDGDKIKRSREKLYNLGYFSEVKAYTEPTDDQQFRDLVFEVEESKTGALTFGLGYSSIEDLVGFIQLEQNNFDIGNPPYFTGGGQKIRAKARFGSLSGEYMVSFTEPYFLGYPLSLGFDIYDRTRKWGAYDQRNTGGDVKIGKRLTDYVRLNTTYKYEEVDISDVSSDATDAIKEEEGEFTTSSLTVGLVRDTRDSIFVPTQGFFGSISTEYAGGFLGADRNFTKNIGDATWFFPISQKEEFEHVISLRLRAGIAREFADSDNVPINERFFLGGSDTIRGYPEREVGPKDEDDNPIGGKSFFIANAEYTFPIWKRTIRGALFYDIGNTWGEPDEIDFNDLFSGFGVGLRMQTPIGPVNLDYGWGVEENEGRLHFSMGYSF